MKPVREASGVTTTVLDDAMQHAPACLFESARGARELGTWLLEHFDAVAETVQVTTRWGRLRDIEADRLGRLPFCKRTTGIEPATFGLRNQVADSRSEVEGRCESSRSSEKSLYTGQFGHPGHHEHSSRKVEGLVRRMPGGSSSLPGRTSFVVRLCAYRERVVRPGKLLSTELLERWQERGLIRAIPLCGGVRRVRADELAGLPASRAKEVLTSPGG